MKNRIRKSIAAILCLLMGLPAACPAYAASPDAEELFIVDEGGFPVPASEFIAHAQWVLPSCDLVSDGVPLHPGALVSTGQTLRVRDPQTGQIILQTQVVVMGDVLGTGQAGLSQLSRIAQAVAGTDPLTGIWEIAADLDGSGVLGISDLVLAAQEYRAVSGALAADFECEILPAVVSGTNGRALSIPLYFAGDARDIPYVSTDTIAYELSALLMEDEQDEPLDVHADKTSIVFTRPNGSSAVISSADNTISFSNYDAFFQGPSSGSLLDPAAVWRDEEGRTILIERAPGSYSRAGEPIAIALGDYAIDIIEYGPKAYLPLQTFADVFLSPLSLQALYNGQVVIVTEDGQAEELTDLYYAIPPQERSAELIAFNYNELCLAMDLLYGLREQHDIADFDSFFRQTELRDALMSPDGAAADRALDSLMSGYLGDGHSALLGPSFYAGQHADVRTDLVSPAVETSILDSLLFSIAREKAFPDGIPGYQEVGDTAFVTFDEFTADPDTTGSAAASEDTMDLITYAHQQITRPGTPIRNVVVDLTCNYGGAVDSGVYLAAWLLGTAQLDQDSALTGAQASTKYRCDVNRDGRFDEHDSITGLNRFCLISPVSFSCGSLVPCMLKGTDVALLGQATGGGACIVQPLTTADGTMLQISGPVRACTQSNGSYYEADRGIAPDYYIASINHFYDREALCAYIASMGK